MVKGISRQVIVVRGPEAKLFEQAIFILREDALGDGITDEALLKEAQDAISGGTVRRSRIRACLSRMAWACCGALAACGVWYLTAFL